MSCRKRRRWHFRDPEFKHFLGEHALRLPQVWGAFSMLTFLPLCAPSKSHATLPTTSILGGVYMRKLALVWVSYWHGFFDFLSCLHSDRVVSYLVTFIDTVARFRTGVKFSPRYNNQGELTPGWLSPAWHFVLVSCKQNLFTWYQHGMSCSAMRGNRSELAPGWLM